MPIDALPATLKQTLHVALYLKGNPPSPSVFTWKPAGGDFQYLFSVEVDVPVPTEFQSRETLTRMAVTGVEESMRQARVDFERTLGALEESRQRFLCLEA